MNKYFKLSVVMLIIILTTICIQDILGYLYLMSENHNFKEMREKSELDCETMPIHCSIDEDNVSKFNILIENNQALEAKDNWGRSALFWSLKNQKISYAISLLENGADPNTADERGNTIFLYSIQIENFDFSKKLLEHGADIDKLNGLDYPETALHFSVMHNRINATRFLLKNGARIDIEDSFGYTVLERLEIHKETIGNETIEIFQGIKQSDK